MNRFERDAYHESMEVLARCRKYARQAQLDTAVLAPAVQSGAIRASQSIVIRGKRVELDRAALGMLLDWQALGDNQRAAFARAIATQAKAVREGPRD